MSILNERRSFSDLVIDCGMQKNARFVGCCFHECAFKNFGNDPFIMVRYDATCRFYDCTFFIETKEDAEMFEHGFIYTIDVKGQSKDASLRPGIYGQGTTIVDQNGFLGQRFPVQCPAQYGFRGYKKAVCPNYFFGFVDRQKRAIVTLDIPSDAKRSSAFGRKCRCSKAKVVKIENEETGEELTEARSIFYDNFVYKVGETVEVKDFDENRWRECAPGIHFFMTKKEAREY